MSEDQILEEFGFDAKEKPRRKSRTCRNTAPENPLLYCIDDVAKLLRLSTRTVWRMTEDGEIPAPIKFKRAVRWRSDVIKSWIENNCRPIK